ncbi:PDDEXK nuclease domain-containing protein [Alcanivorax quisquiliarum]|uniref:PDDEXK nuclease domain-containing protein n=1 Tax=Alcanivorax quisquiliarum TaxID=2933565 RepID=A0ABT0E4F3_9GAMM|nr:PDDEXK nuclease domain-containing protein [Alcanivorax quisquiliarum]MCK0536686.1 PDDEXK nuclease domain-containing protein [Alcanivorax quisquiliarum]
MTDKELIQNGLYQSIAEVIAQARQQVRQAVNQHMVQAYWHIGRLIVEQEQQGQERAEYGKQQLKQLSERLQAEFGKGFDVGNLRNMRQFYLTFPKHYTLRSVLSWSHYRTLMRIENPAARQWYVDEAADENWSVRALERQIGTLYYERLLASKDKSIVEQEAQDKTEPLQDDPKHYLRDPYILDFLNLQDKTWQESDLEQGIISNLQQFLLELGKGFAFVERQQRIRTDDGDYYIDLVFYNFHLKCFLLIDLKMHKLTHQDVGQMDMYVRMYEEHKRRPDDNPTIGLILCSERNNTVAKYSVLSESKQLFASKYLTALPSEEELARELERERERVLRLKEAAARYQSDTPQQDN